MRQPMINLTHKISLEAVIDFEQLGSAVREYNNNPKQGTRWSVA